jgi:hypothetical protein
MEDRRQDVAKVMQCFVHASSQLFTIRDLRATTKQAAKFFESLASLLNHVIRRDQK